MQWYFLIFYFEIDVNVLVWIVCKYPKTTFTALPPGHLGKKKNFLGTLVPLYLTFFVCTSFLGLGVDEKKNIFSEHKLFRKNNICKILKMTGQLPGKYLDILPYVSVIT